MRLTEIASEYARAPSGTLVISPDNESRRELNALIHREMQGRGDVSREEHKLRVLDPRQEMTGADRQWAGQYEVGDVVRYTRGSKVLGIDQVNMPAWRTLMRRKTALRSSARVANERATIRVDSQVYRCTTR